MSFYIETFINGLSQTLLNGSHNNSTTTIAVDDATVFPSNPLYRIRIDSELMLVTGISSNNLTVIRGIEGTTAASHADDAAVDFEITADSMRADLFNGMINVKASRWGAKGDGTTDDTAAIQAALTYAAGVAVYFPPGIYLHSGALMTLDNDKTTIVAFGAIIKRNNAFASAFRINADYCKIIGMEIDGNGKDLSGIEVYGNHNTLERCRTYNNGVHGFLFDGVSGVGSHSTFNRMTQCESSGNGQVGLCMSKSQDCWIEECWTYNNTFEGITSDDTSYRNTITRNKVMSNCTGGGAGNISIDKADLNIISHNQIHGAGSSCPGIIMNNNLAATNFCTIVGNMILDNASYGVYLKAGTGGNSSNNVVSGNCFRGNGTAPVRLDSGCNNNVVVANSMNGASASNAGTGNTIADNT
jgi:hypothetical protein